MKEKAKRTKLHLFSAVVSLVDLGLLLFFPWIQVGSGGSYSLPGLVLALRSEGLQEILDKGKIVTDDIASLEVGIWVETGLFALYGVLIIFHIVSRFSARGGWFGILAFFVSGIALGVHSYPKCISDLTEGSAIGIIFPCIVVLMRTVDILGCKLMEEWKEASDNLKKTKEEEQAKKEESRERLYFPGKYNPMFYRAVWKDFRKNWKDYLLFFVCSSIVFCFIFAGLGMRKLLSGGQDAVGSVLLDSVNTIVMNTIVPIGIVSVFMVVLLLFYYLKQRTHSYGVFLTLGIRKKTLYLMAGMEFACGFLVSIIVGTVLGRLLLSGFAAWISRVMGVSYGNGGVGLYTWFQALGLILVIYLVSFVAAYDIYTSFSLGKTGGIKNLRERMPVKWLLPFIALGFAACLFGVISYSRIYHFENVLYLLLCFAGLFLLLRFGMAKYLLRERKKRTYLGKLLNHQQMFHKSKSAVRYLIILTVIQASVLFYFPFQVISALTAEETDELFPYDIVCTADDKDTPLLEEIQEKYEVELQEYPMVRVSSYDITETMEGSMDTRPQGQHIGVSESTYHALKKALDPDYEAKPLGLDADGKKVYIVHQQDKSAKAKPVDYYMPKRPLLHVGLPAYYIDINGVARRDISYRFQTIQGEEIGSLTGVFHQGKQENIIVFSDAYFEKAKELWRTTDIWTGEPLPEEQRIEGVTVFQGPTKLVLMRTEKESEPEILDALAKLSERHIQEETETYNNMRLDLSINPVYTKTEGVDNLEKERMMTISMNGMVMGAFVLTAFLLLAIKLLTEQEDNKRRAEFFQCMGMRRKERISILRREIFSYCYIPFAMAVLPAAGFTAAAFYARMYTAQDITGFLTYLVLFWIIYIIIYSAVVWVWAAVYAHKTEGGAFRNDS